MTARAATAVALLALFPALPALAAQPQFCRFEGAQDFLEGELLGPLRRFRRPRPPGPGRKAAARHRGALRLVPGHATARARSTRARATTARSSGSPAGRPRCSSTLRSSRCTRSPSARTAASTSAPRRTARCTRWTASGKEHDLLRPRRQVHLGPRLRRLGPAPRGHRREGRVYRVDAKGDRDDPPADRGDPRPLPGRRRQAGRSTPGARPPASSIARTPCAARCSWSTIRAYREVKALDLGGDGSLYAAARRRQAGADESGALTASPPATTRRPRPASK